MALHVGLDASFDNMQDWEAIREKPGEVNITKVGCNKRQDFSLNSQRV
jgi:hypothetical protein